MSIVITLTEETLMEMHADLSERNSGQAGPKKMGEQTTGSLSEDHKTIYGEVLRVDGETYFVKWQNEK